MIRNIEFNESDCCIFFGVPGSGKSTLLNAIIQKFKLELGVDHIFCNYPYSDCTCIDLKYLRTHRLNPDNKPCLLLIDEASAKYSNRDFKNFTLDEFFCKHRHDHIMIMVFAQTYNGMDKKIRDVSTKNYIVERKGIFVRAVPVHVKIGINELTKEICDEYYIDGFLQMMFGSVYIMPHLYWRFFDSYENDISRPSIWSVEHLSSCSNQKTIHATKEEKTEKDTKK